MYSVGWSEAAVDWFVRHCPPLNASEQDRVEAAMRQLDELLP